MVITLQPGKLNASHAHLDNLVPRMELQPVHQVNSLKAVTANVMVAQQASNVPSPIRQSSNNAQLVPTL